MLELELDKLDELDLEELDKLELELDKLDGCVEELIELPEPPDPPLDCERPEEDDPFGAGSGIGQKGFLSLTLSVNPPRIPGLFHNDIVFTKHINH